MSEIRRPILLTSLPRSGSTWVLRVLERANGIAGVFEPDHLDIYKIGKSGMHTYLRPTDVRPEYKLLFQSAFKGCKKPDKHCNRGGVITLSKNFMRSAGLDRRRIVVKSVFSLHNTEWLYKQIMPEVVILLRNPYTLIHSIHRKWPDARLGNILEQKEFVEDYLEPYTNDIKRAEKPYEVLATRVGAYYCAVMEMANRNPSWNIIYHENMCLDPYNEFKKLFDTLDIQWTQDVEDFLNETNKPKVTDRVSDVRRISKNEVDKWRDLLNQEQIQEIKGFYEIYDGIPYKWLESRD